tara:strand:- start:707 stop:1084 length:378 start_codon:yes stop_codon:yes gene_type:complete
MKIKMTNKEKRNNFFNRISADLEFNINEYLSDEDLGELRDYDELYEILEDAGAFDIEIIYYYKALKYLMQNDTSLTISMGIADEMGYKTKDLNSELLASLLVSQHARFEFDDYRDEINELLINTQ